MYDITESRCFRAKKKRAEALLQIPKTNQLNASNTGTVSGLPADRTSSAP